MDRPVDILLHMVLEDGRHDKIEMSGSFDTGGMVSCKKNCCDLVVVDRRKETHNAQIYVNK